MKMFAYRNRRSPIKISFNTKSNVIHFDFKNKQLIK